MNNLKILSDDYYRIEKAIYFMDDHFLDHPNLNEIAAAVHMSKFHFQRLFKRWAGITPSQFIQYLTIEYAKQKLDESKSLLETTLSAGLSGSGRLHDLFVTFEGITPGEYKSQGENIRINYGFHATPFGKCLIGATERGIYFLGFTAKNKNDLSPLKKLWYKSQLVENNTVMEPLIKQIFSAAPVSQNQPFHLLLKGTNFQINVWKALISIPSGAMLSYGDMAALVGKNTATRAVAQAIAHNPISYLIPCHRVIKSTGVFHGYQWGAARKKAILGWEANFTKPLRFSKVL
ncbi:methylated-DNA--[protein]-cysteine S-methyltransferase [candidate division KSB1 bacterium]|nr:methylated-DNA--[protein]-cysteine S-methyltransferase [candidate division KSB1 bacterium]